MPRRKSDGAAGERAYPVLVRPLSDDEGGGYLAQVPDLPGCISDGETIAAAVENVGDAIRSWIRTAEAFGDPVPEPSRSGSYSGRWVIRTPKTLHMRLAEQARAEGVSLNTLAVTLLAEALGERKTAGARPATGKAGARRRRAA